VLEFFRQNGLLSSITLLPYAFLIRINNLINPVSIPPSDNYSGLTNELLTWISNPVMQGVVASLLVFIQALLINRLVIKHKIIKETSHIPGLIYVLLSAFLHDFLFLTPELLSITFIISAIHIAMTTYNEKEAAGPVFTVGFLIGMAALFCFTGYFFFFIGLLSFLLLKYFDIKDFLQYIIGFLLPTFFHSVWEYFISSTPNIFPSYFLNNLNLSFTFLIQDLKSLIVSVLIGIVMIIALISYGSYNQQKPTATQLKINILYWIALFSLLSIAIIKVPGYAHILFLIFPLSIFLAMNLMSIKNKIVAEIVHLFMIIFSVIVQFGLIEI
jgi:hypothetical protein